MPSQLVNKNSTIRVFFAIDVTDEIKEYLIQTSKQLKERLHLPIKWTKENQHHVTLRFLGNIHSEQLPLIIQSSCTISSYPTFSITLQQIIGFPEQKPRFLAIGVELTEELMGLVQLLNEKLLSLGFPLEERAFLPHISLGRFAKHYQEISWEIEPVALQQRVRTITLFQSELSEEGSHYSVIHHFPLSYQEGIFP